MNERELKDRIKSGELGGCYIFAGEEDYLKRHYLGLLRDASSGDETFAAFNKLTLDGKEGNFRAVADAIKSPPMFDPYKYIEWKYPNFSSMREADLAEFEEILGLFSEYDYAVFAILVAEGDIDLGTEKRPGKFARRFGTANILNFPKSTDAALLSWLKKHFEKDEISVAREPLDALLFRAGRSMDVLANEVQKLVCYLKANNKDVLTVEDVNAVASITVECDTYALQDAILSRDKSRAYLALEEMKQDRVDPIVIMGMLSRTYSELVTVTAMLEGGNNKEQIEAKTKMHPYRVGSYIRAARNFKRGAPEAILAELLRVDSGAKYGGVSGYTAIDIFISKCL